MGASENVEQMDGFEEERGDDDEESSGETRNQLNIEDQEMDSEESGEEVGSVLIPADNIVIIQEITDLRSSNASSGDSDAGSEGVLDVSGDGEGVEAEQDGEEQIMEVGKGNLGLDRQPRAWFWPYLPASL